MDKLEFSAESLTMPYPNDPDFDVDNDIFAESRLESVDELKSLLQECKNAKNEGGMTSLEISELHGDPTPIFQKACQLYGNEFIDRLNVQCYNLDFMLGALELLSVQEICCSVKFSNTGAHSFAGHIHNEWGFNEYMEIMKPYIYEKVPKVLLSLYEVPTHEDWLKIIHWTSQMPETQFKVLAACCDDEDLASPIELPDNIQVCNGETRYAILFEYK